MATGEKWVWTIVGALGIGGATLFVLLNRRHRDTGAGWCLGRRDPIRRILYGRDGRLWRRAWLAPVVWYVIWVAWVWAL